MSGYKIKFKQYIVSLYVPEKKNGKVILLLPGLPPPSNLDGFLDILLKNGFVVYYPYFSGSFDSEGDFGVKSSIDDVAKLYSLCVKTKVKELYFSKEIEIGIVKKVILLGMSFSSVVALLGHKNKFDKMVLLSSALIFNKKEFLTRALGESFHNNMKNLLSLLRNAFPFSYRIPKPSDLKDFLFGKLSLSRKKTITNALNGIKFPTLILHGENDVVIPLEIIESIKKDIDNPNIEWKSVNAAHSLSTYKDNAMKIVLDFLS